MSSPNPFEQFAYEAFKSVRTAIETAEHNAEVWQDTAYQWVEQGTQSLGHAVAPVVSNPLLMSLTKLPMLRWVMAALGQVDISRVQSNVQALRQQYPLRSRDELAQQVIRDMAFKAAGVGLTTNLLPPIALTLFALDIAALSALQAEMLYQVAAIYELPLEDPARRGEVLAIYGLSVGGTGMLKTALSIPELIPGLGAILGASSDAAFIFTLGQAAVLFYDRKAARQKSNSSQ